jgi:N-acetylglucosamine kinase-like BadF-type ATPase
VTGDRVAVAIDGGNSKTALVAFDATGRLLANAVGAGTGGGPDEFAAVVGALWRASGIDTAAVGGCVAAIAGLDFAEDAIGFERRLAALFPAAESHVTNDAVAVLWSGVGDGHGVALVCGAGLNAVANGPAGLARVPALGWPSGDWGGADALGREAVRIGARSADGRGPASVLEAMVLERVGLPSFEAVARGVRDGVLGVGVDQLARLLTAAAASGDRPALEAVDRAAAEADALVGVVTRRAWAGRAVRAGTPAVLAGGVFTADVFGHAVTAALERRGFAPRRLRHRPVTGVIHDVGRLAGFGRAAVDAAADAAERMPA